MPPLAPSSMLAAVENVMQIVVSRNISSSFHHRNAWQSWRRRIIRSLSSLPPAFQVPDRDEATEDVPVDDETPALGLRESIAERSADDDEASPQLSVGDDRIVSIPSLNIMEALKADSFDATDGDISSENDVGLDAARPGSPKDTTSNGKAKTSLSKLLMVDIFSKSWSEPDTHENSNLYVGRRRGGGVSLRPSWNQNDTPTPYRNTALSVREESGWRGNDETQMGEPRAFIGEEDFKQESSEASEAHLEFIELADQSASLLDRLSGDDESSTLQLTDFDAVMTRWSQFHQRVGEADRDLKRSASHECTKLLEALEQNYDDVARSLTGSDGSTAAQQPKHSRLVPNAVSYNLVLHTLANSGKGHQVAGEAVAILNKMLDRCEEFIILVEDENASTALPPPPEPSVITFNSTLHAIAKGGAHDAGYYAEDVYLRMEEWTKEIQGRVLPDQCHYRGAIPNARTLSCLLDAWTRKTSQRSGGTARISPERTEALLLSAAKRRQNYVNVVVAGPADDEGLGSNAQNDHSGSFTDEDDTDVIEEEVVDEEGSLTKIDLSDIATAEDGDVAEEETKWVDRDLPPLKPNTVAFNTSIHAWASSQRGRKGARRAQELLSQLETFAESEELEGPDGWIDPSSLVDDGMDEHDLNLCPNARSYSMVMNAWSNVAAVEQGSGESAALHCEAILAKMEERGANDASIRPNIIAYTTCISAWANTRDVEHAASRAEGILNRLLDTHYTDAELPSFEGVDDDASHAAPFNSVITAYARSSDPSSTDRALAILDTLEAYSIPPTLTSYNAALDACARHGDPDRGQAILDRMRKNDVEPDSTSYNTILNSYSRMPEPLRGDRARDFLFSLEDRLESGDSSFVPSRISYASVLNAYARESGDKECGGISTVNSAKAVYDRFIEKVDYGHLYGGTDSHCNAAFLNCCANVYGTRSERREALIMAIQAFEEMKRDPTLHGELNHYIFGTMFKACIRLSSDSKERHRLLKSLFAQACERGCLSKVVMGQFLKSTPSQLNLRVILENGGSKRSIPEEWHSNVPMRHKPSPPSATLLTDNEAGEMRKVERQSMVNS